MRSSDIKPNLTLRRRRFESPNDQYRAVMAVATAWLLLYGFAIASFFLNHGADVLASLH